VVVCLALGFRVSRPKRTRLRGVNRREGCLGLPTIPPGSRPGTPRRAICPAAGISNARWRPLNERPRPVSVRVSVAPFSTLQDPRHRRRMSSRMVSFVVEPNLYTGTAVGCCQHVTGELLSSRRVAPWGLAGRDTSRIG